MAYHIYTTPALVCGSLQRNGADKTYQLYTRDLGMLYATARSVREERSRQRYALQDMAEIRVSLVCGRAGWRVGSVVDVSHFLFMANDRGTRIAIVELFRTLRRFISGEAPNPELYNLVIETLHHLQELNSVDLEKTVLCTQYRILYELGYVAPTDQERTILDQPISNLTSSVPETVLDSIRTSITTATTVSHL